MPLPSMGGVLMKSLTVWKPLRWSKQPSTAHMKSQSRQWNRFTCGTILDAACHAS